MPHSGFIWTHEQHSPPQHCRGLLLARENSRARLGDGHSWPHPPCKQGMSLNLCQRGTAVRHSEANPCLQGAYILERKARFLF